MISGLMSLALESALIVRSLEAEAWNINKAAIKKTNFIFENKKFNIVSEFWNLISSFVLFRFLI